jgi:hypothetical protein
MRDSFLRCLLAGDIELTNASGVEVRRGSKKQPTKSGFRYACVPLKSIKYPITNIPET